MVHGTDNITSLGDNNSQETSFNALETDSIQLPSNELISDAVMTRDGQDLTLETPNGETVVIQNYFISEPTPTIETPNGSVLTENLVNSFLETSAEYAQVGSMVDESPVGAIEEMSGSATVTRADGSVEQLTLGTPIYNGDVVETSAEGAVNILFMDETSMAVSENARMAIDDYQYDPSTESGVTNLSVLKGVFVYTSGLIGRDDPDDVLIETPVGSIGIRGTIIAGNIKPNGESEITVVEGAIVVKNGAGEVTLSDQFETVKVTGFNNTIENTGVKSANDVSKSYGSVSDVAPGLFSSVNDAAKENSADEKSADESEAEEVEAKEEEAQEKEEVKEDQKVEVEIEVKDIEMAEAEAEAELTSQKDGSKNDNSNNGKGNSQTSSQAEHQEQLFVRRGEEGKKPVDPNATNIKSNHDLNGLIAAGSQDHINNFVVPSKFDMDNDGAFDTLNLDPNATVGVAEAGLIQVIDANSIDTAQNPTPVTGDHFGNDAAFLGDYNGDGKADLIVGGKDNYNGSSSNSGSVFIFDTVPGADMQIRDTSGHNNFGKHVTNAGDLNGDGLTDVLIGSDNGLYINLGGAIGSDQTQSSQTHVDPEGHTVLAANSVGDMNGDGFDDFAVSYHAGSKDVITYVVYGDSNISSMDLSYSNLESLANNNPEDVLLLYHGGALKSGENYTIHAFGDVDGDGFDDIQLGSVKSGGAIGEQYVIFGDKGNDPSIIVDGDVRDTRGTAGVVDGEIGATADDDSLVGNAADYYDNSQTNLSIRDGDSHSVFHLNGLNFRNIDGGKGMDIMMFDNPTQSLDFTSIDFEQVSQVEGLAFGGDDQTITLTVENIFNFMRSSDDGTFMIISDDGAGYTGETLNVAVGTPTGMTLEDQIINGLNELGSGAAKEAVSDKAGFDQYTVGEYSLYIDTDIDTVAVV